MDDADVLAQIGLKRIRRYETKVIALICVRCRNPGDHVTYRKQLAYRERAVSSLRSMHDKKVVVIDADVGDDVGDAGVEPWVVGSARYEPVNRVSIAVKGDATEQLASVRDDAKRATIMRL